MATIGNPPPERKSRMMAKHALNGAPRPGPARQQQGPNETARRAPNDAAKQTANGAVRQQGPNRAPAQREPQHTEGRGQGQGAYDAGYPSANEPAAQRSFTSAFAALKQTRLFRALKKGSGIKPKAPGLIGLFEDCLEVAIDHQRARTYLGDDREESTYGQARKEALLLQHLERMGGHPLHLMRYLNTLLSAKRERDFKHFIVDQVKPRLDSIAGRLSGLFTAERRLVAALAARASHQVGARSAENFNKLLTAAGAAEAAHWATSPESPGVRAQELALALRRVPSPVFRHAMIEASREHLKRLAGDTVGMPLNEIHQTWGGLLRSAAYLESDTLPVLAECLLTGLIGKGGGGVTGLLAGVLGPELKMAPAGGALVVQLIVTLTAKGDVKSAAELVEMLGGLIHQARANCHPVLTALRELEARPVDAISRDTLLRQLNGRGALLLALIPTCSRVLEKGPGLPTGSTAVISESLLSLATLSQLSATPAGQRVMYRTLLAQERGRETFLNTLPRVALTLAQPTLGQPLWEAGLTTTHYQFGGRPFLERVALHTGRALVGPLVARARKGDGATAKALLRSMIRNNAALFGLTADGAYLAAESIEALRDKPHLVPLKKTQYRLAKIRKKNSLGQHPNSIEPFNDLMNALAAGGLPQQKSLQTGARLTLLEFEAAKRKPTHLELHVDQLERAPK
jgi:hypothetical protein